jgi:CCR4-NOT transcription complex subunit 7/8
MNLVMDTAMFPVPPLAPVIPAPVMASRLQFVSVAKDNIAVELETIGNLLPRYHYIAIDTKNPDTVHGVTAGATLTLATRHNALVKVNVDEVPALQLGLTLCVEEVNLPVVTDYDVVHNPHSAESVHFLTA